MIGQLHAVIFWCCLPYIVSYRHETILVGGHSKLGNDVLMRSLVHDSSVGCLRSCELYCAMPPVSVCTHIGTVQILEHEDD